MSINIDHQQNTIASSSKTITVDHTGSIVVPKGTTAERPSAPVDGAIRFNTDLTQLEVLVASSWEKVQVGAVSGTQNVFDKIDPCMGGEDFSYMLNEKPGSYLYIGQKDEKHKAFFKEKLISFSINLINSIFFLKGAVIK